MSGDHKDVDDELLARGLIQLSRALNSDSTGGLVYQLTEKGDMAARLLNSTGPIPAWAEAVFTQAKRE